ncbi:zinc finger BED domain-containing protein 4-like [Paramisgurnus dabryanus]|uniref:zinc finger BED domain-containing protein 4-like n=1 Tax=Paramisgurnus dabryanus TaxID=90735 RepID=UPI0031F3D724
MPLKRLQQDVKTRWNSTYYMIQSILEQKRTLCAFAADHELPASMTANHWALLEKTMIVLSPFEELTRAISSSSSTTADVIPTISVLKRLLSQERDTDARIKTMKSTLLQAVNTRFGNIEDEPLYSLATLLDPRYKDRCFTNEEAAMHAKNALIQEVEKREKALETTATTALATAADPAEMVSHAKASGSSGHTSKSTFMMMFDEVLNKEQEESEGGIIQTSALVQVQAYMTEKLIPRSENPFQYWAVNNSRFPALAATASAFLSAPCTSVESERLFSTASNIKDEKRNRLLAERAEMLIFLKKNLTMFIK